MVDDSRPGCRGYENPHLVMMIEFVCYKVGLRRQGTKYEERLIVEHVSVRREIVSNVPTVNSLSTNYSRNVAL